ncbi:hypothetical protein NESM_000723000 [Novymonas esmeraldas]|uniref:Uncharacterized protein n=1 Tax=Novymonas esmeraldas TaxID=1808958 RepID=A0AAW0ETY2_9TRYP
MPGSRAVETVSKALRRRAQLQRWQRQSQASHQHASPSASAAAPSGDAVDAPPSPSRRLPSAESSPSATGASSSSFSSPSAASFSQVGTPAPHASRTLQRAYQLRDTTLSSPRLQRRLTEYLASTTSKAEAAEAFFLVARTGQESLTPATVAHFTSTLLRHSVVAQMGTSAYEAALADAVGAAATSRWGHLEPAETRAFALYQARRLERYAVRGTSFNEQPGLTLEGADNAVVALTEHQLRQSTAAASALPVSCDTLAELVHLDVSWSTALHVYAYATEVARVDPPATMTARLMGLMTGYRTNALGSRPWQAALRLYDRLLESGYEVPLDAHTSALDAVWRSGESFVKQRHSITPADRDRMWDTIVQVRERVSEADVTGDAGCRFTEALIKAAGAAGRWEAAVQLLGSADVTLAATSHRLLVPTAESFLFAMAACNVAQNAAHANALHEVFDALYTLRSAHPEALLVYLQSLRHVEQLSAQIGAQVEALVMRGGGLDRPCTVACLQLLSSRRVRTRDVEKWRVAQRLLEMYDSNPWPQQPQVRKAELQTVFRCCHLICAATAGAGEAVPPCPLLADLRAHLVSVFGQDSVECQWLDDTEIYGLLTAHSWETALAIFTRQVTQRPPARVAQLPIPLRQARQMLAQTLLRCARTAVGDAGGDEDFLLDEERQAQALASVADYLAFAVRTVREVYDGTGDTPPHSILAELLLHQALRAPHARGRQQLALQAMRELSCGVASGVTLRMVDLTGQALAFTEEHVRAVLIDGSASLRAKALEHSGKRRFRPSGCLEEVLV